MQCLWSKTARTPFRAITGHIITASSSLATAQAPLTTAQTSLAAARAVRSSLQHPVGGLQNAFLIVNSLRYSQLKQDTPTAPLYAFESTLLIAFDKPVSPRLSSHVLLHGLIRLGKHKHATAFALQMMRSSLRVRSTSLTVLLASMQHHPPLAPPITPLSRIPARPTNLTHLLSFARDPHTRLALELFTVARDTHHRRSSGMFATLLALCIINGEIILASLIFGFVCKEWHLHKALQRHFDPEDPSNLPGISDEQQARDLHQYLSNEKLRPNRGHILPILQSIDRALSTSQEHKPEHQIRVLAALQALANLASLLDTGQISFSDVSTLLRSLSKAPQVPSEVWVWGADIPQTLQETGEDGGIVVAQVDTVNKRSLVQAHVYFNTVLLRLLSSLSSHSHQPPLDLHACNTLIHHALRHRLSPPHARTVFQYMSSPRKDRIHPGADTLNILMRNGTLMQNEDMIDTALAAYPGVAGPFDPSDVGEAAPAQPHPPSQTLALLHTLATTLAHRRTPPTTQELYTLSILISHLVASGSPGKVKAILYILFPELDPKAPPKATERNNSHGYAHYGPYLYTALLNALLKSGNTALAKKLWAIAKKAERASWFPVTKKKKSDEALRPWVLPVHAYTMMLRCYALTCKKSLRSRSPTSAYVVDGDVDVNATTTTTAGARALHSGFKAYRTITEKWMKNAVHAEAARVSGVQRGGERNVKDRRKIVRELEFPRADREFFRAAVEVFVWPYVGVGGQVASASPPCLSRPQLHDPAAVLSEDEQPLFEGWTAKALAERIARDMVRAGCVVPGVVTAVCEGRVAGGGAGGCGRERVGGRDDGVKVEGEGGEVEAEGHAREIVHG